MLFAPEVHLRHHREETTRMLRDQQRRRDASARATIAEPATVSTRERESRLRVPTPVEA